jgi:hypothetical protein
MRFPDPANERLVIKDSLAAVCAAECRVHILHGLYFLKDRFAIRFTNGDLIGRPERPALVYVAEVAFACDGHVQRKGSQKPWDTAVAGSESINKLVHVRHHFFGDAVWELGSFLLLFSLFFRG